MSTEPETTHPMAEFAQTFKNVWREHMPDHPEVPFELTEAGERLAKFKVACPEEFFVPVERARLKNPVAFDRVANWDGHFRGPCATGATGGSKTRAVWQALRRLWCEKEKSFTWFTAKRLISCMEDDNERGNFSTFFKNARGVTLLFVDDLDKINWQFESNAEALFSFYDWVYREHRACVTTTNKDRRWWSDKMGDAFARRLFDDASFEVKFS